MAYENILVETRGATGLITLNRPQALNALTDAMRAQLAAAMPRWARPNGPVLAESTVEERN